MARYLVEAYIPRGGRPDPVVAVGRVRRAAQALRDEGAGIRYVRSILVPDDETHFHLFESLSIEAVEEVGRRAQLEFDRVTEALEPVLTGEE